MKASSSLPSRDGGAAEVALAWPEALYVHDLDGLRALAGTVGQRETRGERRFRPHRG